MINQLIINTVVSFSLISLVGISFFYIFNTAKYYAIHHASIITIAGFLLSELSKNDFPIFLMVLISLIVSTLLGVLIELLLFRKIRKTHQKPFYLIIASLGVYIILQNLLVILWGEDLKIVPSNNIASSINIFGAFLTNIQVITIVINAIVITCSIMFFKHSKLGNEMRAVSENSELSSIMGINTDRIILYSFGIGSLIASISGILITFDVGMNTSSSFNLLFYGVIALIIGGIGNIKGLILGALLLAIAQNLTAFYIDSKWMDAVTYIILILFLIWKPLGFSGKRLKKTEI
jgi:branched-chain amino acid transport system permease protein